MKSKKIIALLLAVVMCFGMLAACGGDTKPTPTPENSTPVADTTPDPSEPVESTEPTPTPVPTPEPLVGEAGKYTYNSGASQFGTNWNPHTYQTADDGDILNYMADGFFVFDYNEDRTKYAMVPSMAAKDPEDVTADYAGQFGLKEGDKNRAWKYTLKEDLKWNDGTPITAHDFVESAKRLLAPEAQNYRADSLYEGTGAIVGARSYLKQGQVEEAMDNGAGFGWTVDDFTKGEDGIYRTNQGEIVYIAMNTPLDWLQGDTLTATVEGYKETYFVMSDWDALKAVPADETGNIPLTDDSLQLLINLISGNEDWGEDASNAPGYLVYKYTYDAVDWAEVGIIAVSDYELVMVLENELSGFYLKYYIDGGFLVKTDLYDKCANVDAAGVYTNTYGTNTETTASYGPYVLTSFQRDKRMVFEKNANWHGFKEGQYQTDRIVIDYVPDPAVRLELFLQGRLDSYGLSADDMATYQLSDHTYYATGASVFFMALNPNGLDQLKEKQEAAGANINKTILTVKEFRMALSFGLDRDAFCLATAPTNHPTFAMYSDLIVYEPESGATYRSTPQAKKAVADFWDVSGDIGEGKLYADIDEACASITGYNLAMAQEYFNKAYDIAIEQGLMDEDDVIELKIGLPNASSSFYNGGYNYLVNNYTEAVKGTKLEGKLTFTKDDTLGNNFGNALRNNQVDILFGVGWNGSALDPFNLWEAYVDPQYTYDYNTDYSKVMVDVELDGETWTADALTWAGIMNGTAGTITNSKGESKTYSCGLADNDPESRLTILAASEGTVLQQYTMLPLMDNATAQLKGQQVKFGTEEYIFGMGFGGVQYYTYEYDDAEWDAFVASNGGVLDYT